jgi:CD109 antigen
VKSGKWLFFIVMSLLLVLPFIPACGEKAEAAESYVALIPKVLHTGEKASVSLSLFHGNSLTSGNVGVVLLKDGNTVVDTSGNIKGKGTLEFTVPDVAPGSYQLQINGDGFKDSATVSVETSQLVFLETDKPIYKPGQTIQIRVMSLNSELLPVSRSLTIEAEDAKGIKVFKKDASTDDYGMASLELPLSNEPNLGVWKLTASTDQKVAELDVRVEEYVLPKYEVKLDLVKDWFLVNESITGNVSAEYSFGKPVKGEVEITASKYVGKWQVFQTLTKDIDGQTAFEIQPAGYVAGVPEAKGMGNVMLDVVVREPATGYEQKTSQMLTVAATPLSIQIIPDSPVFKPSLPFSFLLLTESPDNMPLDSAVKLNITYFSKEFSQISSDDKQVDTVKGKALVSIVPPDDCTVLQITATSGDASTTKAVQSGYSPSGNFIHLEQTTTGTLKVGNFVAFQVYSTSEAMNFYYEVVSRGRVVFTNFTQSRNIVFRLTPDMAPSSKLLVYQILPNSEVAADYLPFDVEASYPQDVSAQFSKDEVTPGEDLEINIKTEGEAKVGLAAVDRSVFILAENRLNLQQVFDELERLYMTPQAELHEVSIYTPQDTIGAKETFDQVGVTVLTNKTVPEGVQYQQENDWRKGGGIVFNEANGVMPAQVPSPMATGTPPAGLAGDSGLAEVQRVRQYFPETWLWSELMTNADGNATLAVQAPDSITTWMLRAVAMSKDKGLGVAEDQLTVFQPFFLTVDLPYSAIRGEEFPVKVSVYNYLDTEQTVQVELEQAGWFEMLDTSVQHITIAPNDIGGAQFKIRLTKLGVNQLKVTARSGQAADAVIKDMIVAAEGVSREMVDNLVASAGNSYQVDTSIPSIIIDGSGRAYIAVTGSYLAQTIDGLDGLLQMPYGCGEQNMILFAPDVYITKYLEESGQLKPEIMAKAEKLMLTGYQRELTYRRSDGSFSAFGQNDQEGSLWLTAFVLKTFSQAKGIIYIDDGMLNEARNWITSHQKSDGSFESVGFVHHQDLMGGVQGKTALTAYVAIALLEAGEHSASAKAVSYLEGQLNDIDDAYTMTITTYALELAGSALKDEAHTKLMALAKEDENGLYWGDDEVKVQPLEGQNDMPIRPGFMQPQQILSSRIEATAYATLALTDHGDVLNAGKAAKWLVAHRNAQGGFGSTQDTVMALQALTNYAQGAAADVDLTLNISGGGEAHNLSINQKNYDVLQVVEVPLNQNLTVDVQGKGEAVVQVVKRYNLPKPEEGTPVFDIKVDYSADQVEVNDILGVSVKLTYNPPNNLPLKAEMVVLDVAVPTGFEPVRESLDTLMPDTVKRYDVAARKVIFYLEDITPGQSVSFKFEAKALYPVRAKETVSQAYSYYNPQMQGEAQSGAVTVVE